MQRILKRCTFIKPDTIKIIVCRRTMGHKVFVYGTLKRGEPNHSWLIDPNNGKGSFISEGVTKKKYPLLIATRFNIPFLLYSPGNGHNVKGEIYEVDDPMLSRLDELEGHPIYYVREVDEIISKNDNTEEKCWVYFLKDFRPELLARTLLDDYSSKGTHGLVYAESNNESTVEDLKELR